MFTVLTVCSQQQLPNALRLGQSIRQFHSDATFVIGLADDSQSLMDQATIPYPILSVVDVVGADEVARLSAQYTPTEFIAAVKPAFLKQVFGQLTDTSALIYVDPTVSFYQPLDTLLAQLNSANLLLTPHLTRPPRDEFQPDEKYFQNVGLYSSGFLALSNSPESERFINWWDCRVRDRAFINFCEGLCTDQIWLMHVPAFFEDVRIIHELTWHAALWNLHERPLKKTPAGWQVDNQGLLLFANFKGLTNQNEGLFPYQTRLNLRQRSDVLALLNEYRQQVKLHTQPQFDQKPHFGQQPEPILLRGWQKTTVDSLRKITTFIDAMPIPVIR